MRLHVLSSPNTQGFISRTKLGVFEVQSQRPNQKIPVLIDKVTHIFGESPKPIEIMGYLVPETFRAFFLIEDERSQKCWSLELLVKLGDEGTPRIMEQITRGLSDQRQINISLASDGGSGWVYQLPHEGVRRQQVKTVETWFSNFLVASLEIAIQIHIYKGDGLNHAWTVFSRSRIIEIGELKAFAKEIGNLTARTRRTPEFLKEISQIYRDEEVRASKYGDRKKMSQVISDEYLVTIKTAEGWIALARKRGFLDPAPKRKKSATKRKAVTTKQGKEKK